MLTGGGAFGAWEVGALQAFFDGWMERHGEDPPIRVVAGTSTGALIAPFVLLGREEIAEAARWYTTVRQDDIVAPKPGVLLPFPLFAITTSSIYEAGYVSDPSSAPGRLYGKLTQALPKEKLDRLAAAWPERRLAVATLDFSDGRPNVITNSPADMPRLREGILASAMAPLALPPVPIQRDTRNAEATERTPHLDGGVYAVAPFAALFDLAAATPGIALTHVVVISAFPPFPGDDSRPAQKYAFPRGPNFREVGDRMNALLSEASASKEIALARAAIALRRAGTDAVTVREMTGLEIPGPAPRLVELAPKERLGWKALDFNPAEMQEMYRRGYEEGRELRALTSGP